MTDKLSAEFILFCGQSNMQGQSDCLLDDSPVENAFEFRYLKNDFVPLCDPVGEDICCDGAAGEAYHDGLDARAWLARHALGSACYGHSTLVPAFCRAYGAAAGCTVLAVHAAKGSTQAAEWLPGTAGYAMLLKKAAAALALARRQYAVRGVSLVWLQGESDAIAGVDKDTYKEQLQQLHAALQKELGLEHFGIIRVGSFTGTPADAVIQTAQEELCEQDSGFVMLTRMTEELERSADGMNPYVRGHFSARGLARLGEAAGKALAQQEKSNCTD